MNPAAPLIDPSPLLPRPLRPLAPLLERALGISAVNEHHRRLGAEGGGGFFDAALRELGITYRVSDGDAGRIPPTGPLVAVANHPFGGADGLVLGSLLDRVRGDVKVLGNRFLARIPGLSERVIPVDVFGGDGSAAENRRGLLEAVAWVRSGGALAVFPAGAVSHFRISDGAVADPPWSHHVGAVVRLARAGVLPVYFSGRNSWLFQTAGLVHPALRTLLLPRELVNKRGRTVTVRIGRPSPWEKMASAGTDAQRMEFLREKTYFLMHRGGPKRRFHVPRFPVRTPSAAAEALAPPVDAARLEREVAGLPGAACLCRAAGLAAYVAEADRIPWCLREIGRLRERAFRSAGEGTGRAADLDAFDPHYRHLFLWDESSREIAGAYRLGLTDEVVARRGEGGLYTSTLFRFKEGFLSELGPAIELGRSFIRPKYQRKRNSLPLLWRGIAAFIVRHPRYAKLFGPVSISQDYQRLSRDLIVTFLRQDRMDERLSRLVAPRTPPRPGRIHPLRPASLRRPLYDTEEVSLLVSEIESDGKGIPVLLKHYLRLDATLLSFNLDRAFSNVLDGLILLDLAETESRTVRRFLGEDGYRAFLDHRRGPRDAEKAYRKAG